MPSVEREVSRDRSPSPKHKHSFSDLSRLGIPMWDSSDPERAPPPLPLNPQHPDSSPSKPNVSENVAQAAKALAERARANAGPSPYTPGGLRDRSPEKSPTRTPQHKRLQSLQQEKSMDFKPSSENYRPTTPTPSKDILSSSPERMPSPANSSTMVDIKEITADHENMKRPSSKSAPRPILGENTPPSATILAIQNMPYRDHEPPLANVTNSSTPRAPQNVESILSHMQNLTSIATTLQKEMATLSRRSKDNATDLVSLKEATKTRDEDIRKSLRELVTNARASEVGSIYPRGELSRSTSAMDFVPRFLETKPCTPTPFAKSASFPRVSQLNNLDAGSEFERGSSPAPYSVEGAASIAMLEKIIREMGTKEGQERLSSTLTEFSEMSSKDRSELLLKLDELSEYIKDDKDSKALVRQGYGDSWAPNRSNLAPDSAKPTQQHPSVNIVSEELRQALQKIKDSVSQGGGLTGEVKSLVRELRGEVLGMGREIGHKIETAKRENHDLALIPAGDQANKIEVQQIVQDGLADLKVHMEHLIQEKRRQSSSSAHSRHSVDSSEVYALVKQSLAEQGNEVALQNQPFNQESIIAAVKEAYEAYKPEIELQQFGLERDEILQCLKEGLEDYQATKTTPDVISKNEVIEAVQEALQHFNPPAPVTDASEIKEEVLCSVRECLENFQRNQQKTEWMSDGISREDLLGAVREGLGSFKREGAREIEINREDLFHAVKAGLDNTHTPFGGYGDEVLKSLHDIVEGMRVEFKEYSAANGRDTELVLDATKDGLESLRVAIESYVDRSRDVTGKDEVLETLKNGLQDAQNAVTSFVSQQFRENPLTYTLDQIKTNLGDLHEAIVAQENRNSHESMKREQTLQALTTAVTNLESSRGGSNREEPIDDILDVIKDEFEQLRDSILKGSETHKNELIDALRMISATGKSESREVESDSSRDIIDLVRQEIRGMRDRVPDVSVQDSADRDAHVEAIRRLIENAVSELKAQVAPGHSGLEGTSTLQISEEFERIHESLRSSLVPVMPERSEILKAISEGFESLHTQSRRFDEDGLNGEALDELREEFEHLRQSIDSTIVENKENSDIESIVEAIRTGFNDLQARAGSALGSAGGSSAESKQILNSIQDVSSEIRTEISRMAEKPIDLDMTVSYDILDTLKDGISGIRADMESLKVGNRSMTNGDIVLSDGSQPRDGLSKDDFDKLEVMMTQLQIKVEAIDQNAQATHADEKSSSDDLATREALNGIETMIYELRSTVDILVSRKSSVSKDDIDAIETMLQNAKAKIDDQILPALESAVTKEHLDAVEAVVRLTSESVDGLASKVDGDMASKDEIAALYQLLEDANSSLKSFRQHFDSEITIKPAKEDLNVIENICDDIRDKIDNIPTSNIAPTKEELAQLTALVEQFRDSHDCFKSQYESDLEVTAKAFDDRKDESEKILEQIAELKNTMSESKDEIKSRLKRGNDDVRALDEILQGIEDKIDQAPNAVSSVQELLDLIKQEFGRSHEAITNVRSDHDQASADLLEKHETLREYLTGQFSSMLDSRFSEILVRHDEQQQAVEQASQVVAGKAAQQDSLLTESRNVAEDLKVTIDLLGESIATISPTLREATDKMGDDAKTVFNKVEELHSRMDLNYSELMSENQLVRQEISKSSSGIDTLQGTVANFQPQVMATLSNLLALISEHYEYFKNSLNAPQHQADKSSIEETIRSSFASLPTPRIEPPPTNFSSHDTTLHDKLEELISFCKHDSSMLQNSVNELVSQTKSSEADSSSLGKVNDIYEQLQTTSNEISAFIALQAEKDDRESNSEREEAQKASADLARCTSAKDDLERKIENLTATRHSLASDVESLMVDRDSLTAQKGRLAAEVSSLETALRIRREELQEMDARAEKLERRIVDGVMDHSRALLMAKQPKNPQNMSLKRIPSNVSNITASTTTPSSIANAGVNIALGRKRIPAKGKPDPESSTRRIVSLSRMSSNVPRGGTSAPSRPSLGVIGDLKRSQSVKNPAVRTTSWAQRKDGAEMDKENNLSADGDEHSEAEVECHGPSSIDSRSISQSGSHLSASDRRTSYDSGPSELSYGTGSYLTGSYLSGSYLTGSDSMRTTSYGSTIRSIVGGGTSLDESIQESDEVDEEEEEQSMGNHKERDGDSQVEQIPPAEDQLLDAKSSVSDHEMDIMLDENPETANIPIEQEDVGLSAEHKDMVIRPPDGYDSGLGSDLPTAVAMSQGGSDYFASLIKGQDM